MSLNSYAAKSFVFTTMKWWRKLIVRVSKKLSIWFQQTKSPVFFVNTDDVPELRSVFLVKSEFRLGNRKIYQETIALQINTTKILLYRELTEILYSRIFGFNYLQKRF